ncbi:type II/IV secretion system protein [Candidatus Dojkabacteria bacterium]|nr:type II/IV secretion system protein [Candidatus Dojkabacteria bacterium]
MSKTQVIDYLEEKGIIEKGKADKLRVEMVKSGKTEDLVLEGDSSIKETDVVQAKAEIFNIPFVDLTNKDVPESLLSEVDAKMLQKFKAIPFEKTNSTVKIAMINPFDIQAIQALQTQYPAGTKIKVYIATSDGINLQMGRKLGDVITSEVSEAVEDVGPRVTDLDEEDTGSLEDDSLQNAPVARIVNSILQYAIKSKASDIHIEPMEKKLRVRFRIHGVMSEKLSLPKHLTSAVVSRVKIMSDLKIDEKRIPQDGRFQVRSSNFKVDVRVSTMPSIYGEKVVMRLLETSVGVPALETTGMRGSAYKTYEQGIRATEGIILITGPTGSGKTRTLAGTLDKINTPDVNIMTLENPVEIRIPGVTQVQINPAAGLTFAKALRSVLRQDPDKIMVGEIRDTETAELAVEASLTGHLVLATLHTNSAAAAIPRMLEMGIEPYLLSATLKIAVAQRLPRRICSHCHEPYKATEAEISDINKVLAPIPGFELFDYAEKMCKMEPSSRKGVPSPNMKCPETDSTGKKIIYLYRGKGCDRCNGTGYQGRVGIFEVLRINEKIVQLMMNSRPASEIHDEAVKNGMISMRQDGYLKALEGITTIEEILRVSRD